jgi:hypothetical protein
MPGPRGYRITDEFVNSVCAFIRSGGFAHVAAEAAGVPADVFANWLRYGTRRRRNPLYRRLLNGVRQALATARLRAELELYKAKSRDWLLHGPGRERPDAPGWTAMARVQRAAAAPTEEVAAEEQLWRLCELLSEALLPYPEARAEAARVLSELDARESNTASQRMPPTEAR